MSTRSSAKPHKTRIGTDILSVSGPSIGYIGRAQEDHVSAPAHVPSQNLSLSRCKHCVAVRRKTTRRTSLQASPTRLLQQRRRQRVAELLAPVRSHVAHPTPLSCLRRDIGLP